MPAINHAGIGKKRRAFPSPLAPVNNMEETQTMKRLKSSILFVSYKACRWDSAYVITPNKPHMKNLRDNVLRLLTTDVFQ